METEIKRKERRDENNVCRNWIQMKESCLRCLFDVLCSLKDQNDTNKNRTRETEWDKNADWGNQRENKED